MSIIGHWCPGSKASAGHLLAGYGLGLAIARKSVEMLGGTLTASSRVGEGSTFTLKISDAETASAHEPVEGVRPQG